MQIKKTVCLLGLSTAFAGGCGPHRESSEVSSASSAVVGGERVFEGVSFQGKSCTLKMVHDAEGKLKSFELTEEFKVDYKIPTPGSGLYGVYYWPTTLQSEVHLAAGSWAVKPSFLRDAEVVEGKGKALFWDGNRHHQLVFKPSTASPRSVTYSSAERVLGAIPTVMIEGLCNF